MNEPKHPRAVIGLILLAVLCTVALGLQEWRTMPLVAYSPASPVGPAPRRPRGLRTLDRLREQLPLRMARQVGTRAFWLQPWPWIVVGLVGFGLLTWGIAAARAAREGGHRMERD